MISGSEKWGGERIIGGRKIFNRESKMTCHI